MAAVALAAAVAAVVALATAGGLPPPTSPNSPDGSPQQFPSQPSTAKTRYRLPLGDATLNPRVVDTRYGRLQGLQLTLHDSHRHLRNLHVYLGVPYATPPVGANRFAPTRTPSPWSGVRPATTMRPACPQIPPDISNETAAALRMPRGRIAQIRRLLPFMANQSEDCLYLNIYAPEHEKDSSTRRPVLVYIHGDTFDWGTGNAYDGSILAAYGDMVVVTVNYRLGVLGFLNANPSPGQGGARVANYGLIDQLAALHWVQQAAPLFGGDPTRVTLMGHGSGAACVQFLVASPAATPGLFQRAVLLSGSALSRWSLVENPAEYALRLAKKLNCTLPKSVARDHEELVDCARSAPLDALLSAASSVRPPSFLSAFAPSLDGVVIKYDVQRLLLDSPVGLVRGQRTGQENYVEDNAATLANAGLRLFPAAFGAGAAGGGGMAAAAASSSAAAATGSGSGGTGAAPQEQRSAPLGRGHDFLFGVVTAESLDHFPERDLLNGFEQDRRDRILRTYIRNVYRYHLHEIFLTAVNEYTDWDRTELHPTNTRDATIGALGDSQFVAPLVQTGDLASAVRLSKDFDVDHHNHINHDDDDYSDPETAPSASGSAGSASSGSPPTTQIPQTATAPAHRTYFYVFDYQSKDTEYPQRMGTAHGEELPFIWGAPVVTGMPGSSRTDIPSPFGRNFTKAETALSEAVIMYWANFARSGNPNPPSNAPSDNLLPVSRERNRFRGTTWGQYEQVHQKHLEISMKPKQKNHFRAHQLSVWLRLIPELHRAGLDDVSVKHNQFRNHHSASLYDGPVRPPLPGGDSDSESAAAATADCVPGTVHYEGRHGNATPAAPPNSSTPSPSTTADAVDAGRAAYSTALGVTIAIGCSLLVLNMLIFAGVYYQRDRTRLEVKSLQKHQQQIQGRFDGKVISAKYPLMNSSSGSTTDVDRDPSAMMLASSAGPGAHLPPPPPPDMYHHHHQHQHHHHQHHHHPHHTATLPRNVAFMPEANGGIPTACHSLPRSCRRVKTECPGVVQAAVVQPGSSSSGAPTTAISSSGGPTSTLGVSMSLGVPAAALSEMRV